MFLSLQVVDLPRSLPARMRFVVLLIFIYAPFVSVAQLQGKVVAIADGDTFTMLVDNKQIKIRLHGIDCPEKKQDFGNVAKEYVSGLVFGKVVEVRKMNKDRYGRTVGIATVNGLNVNEALLKAGLAWHYKEYDTNPAWAHLEETARKEKKGLWVQPNAIPPWQFRKRKKPARQ